jgi:16S rRNA G966 N2-methylase RsmD
MSKSKVVVDDYEFVNRIFDATVNFKDVCFTNTSIFEVSTKEQADKTSKLISYWVDSESIAIIETSAGIGGNTVSFCKFFHSVYSIEFDQTTYDCLESNVKLLCDKVPTLYLDSCINAVPRILSDPRKFVIFMDPPWGGPDFKLKKKLELYYSKVPVNMLIKDYARNDNVKLIVLKAPVNLQISLYRTPLITHYQKCTFVHNENGRPLYTLHFFGKEAPEVRMPATIVVSPAKYKKLKLSS